MTTCALYLESGPRRRKTPVHVLDLLGCIAVGPTTDEALATTPDAIRAYRRFLERCGEVVDLEASIEMNVAEHITEGMWVGNGTPYVTFGPDLLRVTEADIDTYLGRCGTLRAELAAWASQRPDLGLRVYRTFGGLRFLITNQVFDPSGAERVDILRALARDPLYVRLCQAQAFLRARLTPKPWRCGMATPPNRYLWENASAEARYWEWEQRDEQTIAPYAVCKFIKALGPDVTHPDVEPVLGQHGELTGSAEERQLA